VDRGQHRGSSSRTVAELIERWFSWRQQVRPISPVTLANYRGAIDRYILPTLGRAKVQQVDASTIDALYEHVRAHGGSVGTAGSGFTGASRRSKRPAARAWAITRRVQRIHRRAADRQHRDQRRHADRAGRTDRTGRARAQVQEREVPADAR
jgi:hypothetical protein